MTTLKTLILFFLFAISTYYVGAQSECNAANGYWSDADEEHPFLCDPIDDGKTLIIPAGITVTIDNKIDMTEITSIIIRGVLFFEDNIARLSLPENSGVLIESGGEIKTNVKNNSQRLNIGNTTYWTAKAGDIKGPIRYGEVVLPVELVSFVAKADEQQVSLEWVTATELNSDEFAIEHSMDGRIFSTIAYEGAAGTTNLMQSYRYTHEFPLVGNNYYRLRQIDFDGAESFSDIIVVDFQTTAFFSLRQSSDFSSITISFQEEMRTEGAINIFDLSGRMMNQYTLSRLDREVEIDISEYQIGQYVLQVTSGGLKWAKPFVKMAA